MEPREAVLSNLLILALADGTMSESERRLVDRYRRALGVRRRTMARLLAETPSRSAAITPPGTSRTERLALLRMMARVGFADGRLLSRERSCIERLALALGVDLFSVADVLVEVEERESDRRRHRRGLALTAVMLAPILALVFWISRPDPTPEASSAPFVSSPIFSLDPRGTDVFRDIAARHEESVLFLAVWYDLVRGTDRRTQTSTGTGFFATPEGHILTSKHVVEPWKYRAEDAQALNVEGYRLEQVRLAAWPHGACMRQEGKLFTGEAYRTGGPAGHALSLLATLPDRFVVRREVLHDGMVYEGPLHAQDSRDLALLRADPSGPVVPLPLRLDPRGIAPLDPVLVFGFPAGTRLLEHDRAIPTLTLGRVRKVEETIYLDTPIHKGTSGGPVIDARGDVVGIVTRYVYDPSLGCCVRAHNARPLLPSVESLLKQARLYVEQGHAGAALDELALAHALTESPKSRRAIEEQRNALLAERDARGERIAAFRESGEEERGRVEEQQLLSRFGPVWSRASFAPH